MEHTDRQAIYFSLHLGAALTALFTEIALMAWAVGLTDSSTAQAAGRLLLALLGIIGLSSLLWPMPRRPKRQLLMSAGELWQLTCVGGLILLLGFVGVCADC